PEVWKWCSGSHALRLYGSPNTIAMAPNALHYTLFIVWFLGLWHKNLVTGFVMNDGSITTLGRQQSICFASSLYRDGLSSASSDVVVLLLFVRAQRSISSATRFGLGRGSVFERKYVPPSRGPLQVKQSIQPR
ncbi:hypothetical protein V7795_25755, partial [Rhizobium laguerreae]|uniref:hypothetical protein n=1 Tax=Rhizobium laguerreae TaxID=1076926 RepID=UPI002FFF64CE